MPEHIAFPMPNELNDPRHRPIWPKAAARMRPLGLRAAFASLLFIAASCSTAPEPLPAKAVVTVDEVSEAIAIEKATDARNDKFAPTGSPWFAVSEGTSPILITAPHGTKPFREGAYRFSDGGGTTALARVLGKLCKATVIYTTYESPSDPNYYDENAFKEAVKKELATGRYRLVLDIHGSHWFRVMRQESAQANAPLKTCWAHIKPMNTAQPTRNSKP